MIPRFVAGKLVDGDVMKERGLLGEERAGREWVGDPGTDGGDHCELRYCRLLKTSFSSLNILLF